MEKSEYSRGTYLLVSYPWGINRGGAAMCSDGKVRKIKRIAPTADTFFSIPASIEVKGKTVAGYVTFASNYNGEKIVQFRPYTYRKNHGLLPKWPTISDYTWEEQKSNPELFIFS